MQNNIFLYKKDESLELKYHFHKPAFYVWFAFVFVFHFKSAIIYIYIFIVINILCINVKECSKKI